VTDPTDLTEAQRHVAQLDYELTRQDALERLRFQAEFSQSAWKGLTLVNGGAIIALFTFIGNYHHGTDPTRIWAAFACFAGGLALNLASIMTGFLSQSYFMKSDVSALWNKQAEMHGYEPQHRETQGREFGMGNLWWRIAVGACSLSLAAFIVGSGLALAGVTI
jgi:hypothetical protein